MLCEKCLEPKTIQADKLITNLNLFIFLNSRYIQHLQEGKATKSDSFELKTKLKNIKIVTITLLEDKLFILPPLIYMIKW